MKTRHVLSRTIAVLVACVWVSVGYGQSEDTAVSRFFPSELVAGGPERLYAYAETNFGIEGERDNYVVAAFSNGFDGAVRVLHREGASLTLVAAPSFEYMGGIFPSVEMIDVDTDGSPEAIVGFSTGSGVGPTNWVLKWNGSTLQSIGPLAIDEEGRIAGTALNGALFIDYSGDSALEIIAGDDDAPLEANNDSAWLAVFSLSNGQYEKEGTIDFLDTFVRDAGTPVEVLRGFSVANLNKKYVMNIMNGSGTDDLVSSAEIKLNGKVVAGPEQFRRNVRKIAIPVTVAADNVVSVKLFGSPGSALSIAFSPQ